MKIYEKYLIKYVGFSLIELMIVIVIIGILTATARPNYRKYVANSKMAEGYVGLADLSKKESIYHGQYNEFYGLGSRNPAALDQTMVIASSGNWSPQWVPMTIGAHTWFSYTTIAGKTNASGSELNTSPNTGNTFQTTSTTGFADASYSSGSPASCTASGNPTASSFGVVLTNTSDWTLITAVGDLDNNHGSTCTIIYRLLESSAATVGIVKMRNPVVLNPYN